MSLTLIPTPIDNETPLEPVALEFLRENWNDSILLWEEDKACRRRWLHWGLPREAIEKFELYNEHTRSEVSQEVIAKLKEGKKAILMSDCGLPAFCDPGWELVNLCHQNNIEVKSTPFSNSIALAVALSGFAMNDFYFAGFAAKNERDKYFKNLWKRSESIVLMDTPYRLERTLDEIKKLSSRECFLAMNLNMKEQKLMRFNSSHPPQKLGKQEFILVIS
jgi:16S rRNA (cytidine1402-2'-O)-methyltransferase